MKIDNHLTWNDYVTALCRKIGLKLRQLRRLKSYVPQDVLNKIYTGTIQPCIDYAISVWGRTSDQNLLKIQRLQNHAARIVCNNFDYVNSRGIDLVASLRWMNVKQRADYFTTILMFKCIRNTAPTYLSDPIDMYNDINERSTRRHPLNIHVPFVSSQIGMRSFAYNGAKLWNQLPSSVKETQSLQDFKHKLRQHIM